jgi:hypothetical protein
MSDVAECVAGSPPSGSETAKMSISTVLAHWSV